MTGRPPVPTALKTLQGNPGKRALSKTEPKPRSGASVPAPPAHLSEEGRKEWQRVGSELLRLGLLTECDLGMFAAYCQAWGRWVEAETMLRSDGPVIVTDRGPRVSPWLRVTNEAMAQFRSAAQDFGMTPASRTKVSATPVETEDEHPIQALMRKRREQAAQGGA